METRSRSDVLIDGKENADLVDWYAEDRPRRLN
jgi:hypothetical protein